MAVVRRAAGFDFDEYDRLLLDGDNIQFVPPLQSIAQGDDFIAMPAQIPRCRRLAPLPQGSFWKQPP
jgi:hypothetical protein